MQKVLLIDDDVELVQMLKEYIEQEDFDVQAAHDGVAGVQMILRQPFDIVVLDVMMPRLNGIETLKAIRQHSNIPVIMLTAKGDNTDRIVGLELGADDYVPKPSSPRELVARIRAILRRVQPLETANASTKITVGALCIWPAQRLVEWGSQPVMLTSSEYSLLEVLAKNAGQIVSKQDLSQQALGRPLVRFDRSIDVHLSSIRHKLGLLPDGRHCIQTVFRSGYQLLKS
jgi:two-component system, OmpR family, response regulator